jgi:leucyl aminopeptidase
MKAALLGGRFERAASTLPQLGVERNASLQAFAEGMLLGSYRFTRYKSQPEPSRLQEVVALVPGNAGAADALERGRIYAEAANWARDLVNASGADVYPSLLSEEATESARQGGMDSHVLGVTELQEGGFGGILGVGGGSMREPRLIELTYTGAGDEPPIALVGKGVTYDTGGINLKQHAQALGWMKGDMAGAAAVLAAMRAIGRLRPRVNVVAVIPAVENFPGVTAYRPGDVLRHRNGMTTEVTNTDAEGRVILADAIAYAAEKHPAAIVDAATLTGAWMGQDFWEAVSEDTALAAALVAAGEEEGEPGWHIPLWEGYREFTRSAIADQRNFDNADQSSGSVSAIHGALFMKPFAAGFPYAHLDIVGPAFRQRPNAFWSEGATGAPARTLIRFIERRAAS